ncbi:MAG: beta strand repeat-containing protein [Terriglobia bacterium]
MDVVGSLSLSGTSMTTGNGSDLGSAPYGVSDYGAFSLSNGASIKDAGGVELVGGYPGNAALTIASGSVVTDGGDALVYSSGGFTAQATVTGSGSQWNNRGNLYVYGNASPASLLIQAGGAVTDTIGEIAGGTSGAIVSATVDGAGSTWSNSSNLFVGYSANGTLTIQNGGMVTSNGGAIADGAGSQGVATITGPGSQWNNSSYLQVGAAGKGALNITNAGTVTGGAATIAEQSGSAGSSATVDGMNSTWTVNGTLTVGQDDTGSLTIQNQGAVKVSAALTVGGKNTGVGTVLVQSGGVLTNDGGTIDSNGPPVLTTSSLTVTGVGSNWTNGGELTVGDAGFGAMTVSTKGVVSNLAATVGAQAGSNGTVTVTGGEAKWLTNGDLTVGENGTGTLAVAQGGYVNNADGTIGGESGSTGTATVTDSGSEWANSGDLTVGDSGTGTFTIQKGGAVSSTGGTIGGEASGKGTVTITSGSWSMSADLTVGAKGYGVLNGTDATITSAGGSIGESPNSIGAVTLGSSNWTMTTDLSVGGQGAGTLNLAGSNVSDQEGTIGDEDTGVGGVTVATGSTWTNSGDLTVGNKDRGTLGISSGGKVDNAAGDVGSEMDSQGTVTVEGLWQNSQDLTIGDSGNGTMTIDGGGVVNNTDGDIASNTGSTGKVTVQGTGIGNPIPTWTSDGSLKVGDGGTGELDVLNNGQVYSESGAIGGAVGSQGTVKVDGAGSLWAANEPGGTGNIEIGTDKGAGKLTVSNGGTVKANNIEVGANGTLIAAVTVDAGGKVSPGDPGPMNITGPFDLASGATLTLDIASATDYDSLNIKGNGTFDGIINLDFIGGFAPSSGDSFDFITDTGGTFAWDPSSLNFLGITPGAYTTDLTGGFGLTATSNWAGGPPPPPSSTPEPATVVLLATGLLALAFIARRFRVEEL